MEIDIEFIKKKALTVIEYLALILIYQKKMNKIDIFEGNLGNIYNKDIISLQSKGYIKIINKDVELRLKAIKLFEGERDPFLVWFNTFPLKTPSGRYLRPSSDNTIKGKSIRKKWNKHFLNKPSKQELCLKSLSAEIDWRKSNNKMDYMHNAETWLNQGDWELYKDLISNKKSSDISNMNDF